MFKHIKNKEYVHLNKYLKKKYLGGGGEVTSAEEKLKLICIHIQYLCKGYKSHPNVNKYIILATTLKIYLNKYKISLDRVLNKYKNNLVIINFPYMNKYNGIIGKIIDFNYRNDNNALVLYIDIDNTEKKIILPRKYISAYKYPHYSHKHKCKSKK